MIPTELYGSQQTVNLRWRMWRVFMCQWPSSVPTQFGVKRSPFPDAQVTPTGSNPILKDHIGSLQGPFEGQITWLHVSLKPGTTSAQSRLPWKPNYGRPISWILLKVQMFTGSKSAFAIRSDQPFLWFLVHCSLQQLCTRLRSHDKSH